MAQTYTPTFLDVICHTGYRKIPNYHENFLYPMLEKVVQVHITEKAEAQWKYVLGTVKQFLKTSAQTDSYRELVVLLYILANEKSLREDVYKHLLLERKRDATSHRYKFFKEEWETYLLEQTDLLKTVFTQDIEKACVFYSNSLCEAWIDQKIQKRTTEKLPPEKRKLPQQQHTNNKKRRTTTE